MPKREYGTGSVFRRRRKLRDGRWRVFWIAQVSVRDPDGKRRFLTRWKRDRDAAMSALATLNRQLGLGSEGDEDQTLGTWMETWFGDLRVKPSTLVTYQALNRLHIDPFLGPIPLSRLRPSDIRRLVTDLSAKGLSPATVRGVLTMLRSALAVAVRDGILPRNPADNIPGPRMTRTPIEALTPQQAARILEAVAGDPLEALYVLLLGGGLRVGEAVGLDWRDVDLDIGRVSVRVSKTPSGVRHVVIGQRVTDALRAHRVRAKRIGANEPVFVGLRTGERLRKDAAWHHWQRILLAAGLPPMRQHDLRHGHATLLTALGVPMVDIAARLGHARASLTQDIYVHSQPSADRRAVDLLDHALSEGEA